MAQRRSGFRIPDTRELIRKWRRSDWCSRNQWALGQTEDLGADSLDLVQITMALEERFALAIPDERAERVHTVGDVFELMAEFLPARASAH